MPHQAAAELLELGHADLADREHREELVGAVERGGRGPGLLVLRNGEALPLNQGAVKLRRSSGRVAVRLRGDSRDWLRCAWLNRRIRGMNGCWRRWLRRRGWLRCRSWRMVSNWLESWLHSS